MKNVDTETPAPGATTARPGFVAGFEAFQAVRARRIASLRERLGALLPVPRPAVLEIGSGHGHFLAAYAAAHREQHCLGLDLIGDRVRRATRKRDRAGLGNLTFLQCEAAEFLQSLPAEAIFDRIFVLFPDPWPKKRHHKNRLLAPSFLTQLARHAAAGSRLYFRTDHRPYFDQVEETVIGHPEWNPLRAAPWPFEQPTVFQQRADSYYSLVAGRAAGQGREGTGTPEQEL